MICLLLLALGAGAVMGQGVKANTLEYKFNASNDAELLTKVPHNGAVQVHVKNVNPFLYDIEIEGQSLTFNNQAPAGLVTALIPSLDVPSTDENKATTASVTPQTVPHVAHHDGGRVASAEVDNANKAYENIQAQQQALIELEAIAENKNLSVENLAQEKDNWLKRNYPKADAQTIQKEAQKAVECWDGCYQDAQNSLQDPVQLKALAEMQTALVKADYQALPTKINTLYNQLAPASFEHYSIPFIPTDNADELVIHVKISPKESAEATVGETVTEYPCTLRVTGGLKVDFSAGVGLAFMPDAAYVLKDLDTALQVTREPSSSPNIGALALVHFSYQTGASLTGGLSAGVMYDDSKRLRYLLGGSLLIGRRQRIAVSGGVAVGKVQLLSNTQQEDQLLPPGSELNYVERFRVGGFFGLSYNLSN